MAKSTQYIHTPVLPTEAINLLHVKAGEKYIDATVGGGGHTERIIAAGGIVFGIDRDPEAVTETRKRLGSACLAPSVFREQKRLNKQSAMPRKIVWGSASQDHANKALRSSIAQPSFRVVQGNFEKLSDLAQCQGFTQISGILFDLGASTHQLLSPTRGFSFQFDAPLDMRMDPNLGVTARDLINALGKKELYDLFTNLAQEERARAIAARIVSTRSQKPIETTGELAHLVENVYHRRRGRLHPATKVFQALRIAVNDELYALTQALPQALQLLKPKGRIIIISFHEGEDRIAKKWLNEQAEIGTLKIITKKPLQPSATETEQNPHSRSAKLRAAEKK